ncbi:hypothetical protein AB0M47_30190 [Hamadaea sp. NPDC051192]|uniref:hypothetical protein n=1 Tax=Hamadaea sp. NPDC051192 TaxID=3154940 RepID=UPI0034232C10
MATTRTKSTTGSLHWLRPPPVLTALAARPRTASDLDLDEDFTVRHSADRTRPAIAFLGPVHIEASGPPPEERQPFFSELVMFLAQRGSCGASTDEIITHLWRDRAIGANVVRVYKAKAPKWLGEDDNSEPWIPRTPPAARTPAAGATSPTGTCSAVAAPAARPAARPGPATCTPPGVPFVAHSSPRRTGMVGGFLT